MYRIPISASISVTTKILVVSIETDSGSYSQADSNIQ